MEQFDEYGFPSAYPPQILDQMRSQLRISAEEFRQLHLCFDAANNLYATITLKELYGLCSRYFPSLTQEDFLEAAEVIAHEDRRHYSIVPREIFHQDTPSEDPMDQELVADHLYAFDDTHYYDLVEQQKHKPLYAPDWTEFSKYADQYYIEPSLQHQALARYLQNTQRKLRCPPAEIVDEFYCQLQADDDLQYIIQWGQRLGIRFQDQRDFRNFLVLLLKLSHHTRRYIHRGHTPAELELPPQTLEDVLNNVSYDNNYIDPLEKLGHMLRAKTSQATTTSGKPSRNAPLPLRKRPEIQELLREMRKNKKRPRQANKAARKKQKNHDDFFPEEEPGFSFVAGYTSWGFPYDASQESKCRNADCFEHLM